MKKGLVLVFTLLTLVGCASKKQDKQDIEAKAAANPVTTPKALGGTIHELIHSSKTLTVAQKKELEGIIEINKKTAMELSEKSYQLRAVLIEELLSGKSTKQRVKIIEKDIKKIEHARLKNTFDTVKKISAIVSKHPDHKQYSDHLLNMERAFR